MGLVVVRDLRGICAAAGPEEVERFETDVFAGFVLARSAAGLSDNTIRSDVSQLEQVRIWFGKPLWDMEPRDADGYFGTILRPVPTNTRLARAQAVKTYVEFLELWHKVEIHNLTGRVVECPFDEMNRPRGRRKAKLRIPPTAAQVGQLFAGWRGELTACRKFGPTARNYAASRLMTSEDVLPLPGKGDGLDEIHRQDRLRLGAQEVNPPDGPPLRGRVDSLGLEDLLHGGGSDLDIEQGEFAVDAPVAPSWILGRHTKNEARDRGESTRTPGPSIHAHASVTVLHQVAMPPQHRARQRHQQR